MAESNSHSLRPARGLRILYAEDDPVLRPVVATFLRKHGHTVSTAPNGEEALQLMTTAMTSPASAYDLIITDLQMPVLSGLALIRALRQAQWPLEVVVYSSAFTPTSLEELALLRVAATIPKGTRPEYLAEMVNKVGQALD